MNTKARLARLERRVPRPAPQDAPLFDGLLSWCTVDELTAMIEHADRLDVLDDDDPVFADHLTRAAARRQQYGKVEAWEQAERRKCNGN